MQIRSLLSIASLLFLLISMPSQVTAVDCMADQEKALPEVMQCLSNQIQQLAGENKRLQTDVVNLQSNVQKLTSENQNLQTEVANLRGENRRLRNDVTKLKDAVQVAKNGNVGIGTNTPGQLLELLRNDADVAVRFHDPGQYWYTMGIDRSDAGTFKITKGGNLDANSILSLTYVGNVGIGTTKPQYKLDVKGTIRGQNVSPSDQRLKHNIHPLHDSLTKVTQLRGVSFNWKDNSQNQTTQIGLIAQEVEPIFPELVSTDSKGYKSIAYGKLTVVLVEAIKELQQQVAALKAQ
ncbi:hypothetical protein TI05_13685 [Achromatium sp. WMS3]|nr:hypothetical protein TI05_13685 [Achromatium sp. WMS3]